MFKRAFVAFLLVFSLAVPAWATTPALPAEQIFVQSLGERALSILADKKMTKEQANANFKKMLNDNFDVPAIGRFSLGRYWNVATPAQQQEYQQLFNRMVEKIYTDRFSLYSGETFNVLGTRADTQAAGDKAADKIVLSQVVRPQGPPVNVEWRVRGASANQFKIVDVIVEGVSMSVTQRAEFSSVIQRGGGTMDALLQVLRERTAVAAK